MRYETQEVNRCDMPLPRKNNGALLLSYRMKYTALMKSRERERSEIPARPGGAVLVPVTQYLAVSEHGGGVRDRCNHRRTGGNRFIR